ncbi:MAG TPA: hypothetical protein VFA18_18115 [Gemmataceae bacterium]|nr:hypothetical protein [Gemmataceae bacterium]
MTVNMNCPVVGVFDTTHQADKAVAELHGAGFAFDQITLLAGPASGTATGLGAADGKLIGASATSSVAAVHLADLIGQGVPASDVQFYEQEFRRGRTLVIVPASEQAADARTILHAHGAFDATLLHCPTSAARPR